MLNTNINIDLHIHSAASRYKEPVRQVLENGTMVTRNIVELSTKENIDILLNKLDSEENAISLFSITDHNRFDSDLYKTIAEKLSISNYKHVRNVVAGVEFDVQLETDKDCCHIIVLFNAKNHADYSKIESKISKYGLKNADQFYEKFELEKLIVEIGLECLVLGEQRVDIINGKRDRVSVSGSVSDTLKYIKLGYFDAIEVQKPKLEGIIKVSSFRNDINDIAFLIGSDCHDWNYYPKHDATITIDNPAKTTIKSLPTFKGLLMAFSSPKTRYSRKQNVNRQYIESITINGKIYELSGGLNAIIGENGSGKSLLISSLVDSKNPTHYKKLIEENGISFDKKAPLRSSLVVRQAQLIENRNKADNDSIFETDDKNFSDINHIPFRNAWNLFATNLHNFLSEKISCTKQISRIYDTTFILNEEIIRDSNTFFMSILNYDGFENVKNPHKERLVKLKNIKSALEAELSNNYYSDREKTTINESLKSLTKLIIIIEKRNNDVMFEISVKNSIVLSIKKYNNDVNKVTTDSENIKSSYIQQKEEFINSIIKAIEGKVLLKKLVKPKFPCQISGESKNPTNGFIFKRIAKYNEKSLGNEYMKTVFVNDYDTLDKILKIDTEAKYCSAIRQLTKATTLSTIEEALKKRTAGFIEEAEKYEEYITE